MTRHSDTSVAVVSHELFAQDSAFEFDDFSQQFSALVSIEDSPSLAKLVHTIAPGIADLLWQELAQRNLADFYVRTLTNIQASENVFGLNQLNFDGYPDATGEFFQSELGIPIWIDACLAEVISPNEFEPEQIAPYWGLGGRLAGLWSSSQNGNTQLIDALTFGVRNKHLAFEGSEVELREAILTSDVRWFQDPRLQSWTVFEAVPNLEKITQLQNQSGVSYAKLSDDQKLRLISRIASTLVDSEAGRMKIPHYLLSLLLNHSETPNEGKALISLHGDEHIKIFEN
jgi:hypothetical protein